MSRFGYCACNYTITCANLARMVHEDQNCFKLNLSDVLPKQTVISYNCMGGSFAKRPAQQLHTLLT